MDIKELMIGNLVYRGHFVCEVIQLNRQSVLYDEDKATVCPVNSNGLMYAAENIEKLRPVPLTKDWLLKLGFEHNADMYDYTYKNLRVALENKRGECIFCVFYNHTVITRVKYVHELQNIIRALGLKKQEYGKS